MPPSDAAPFGVLLISGGHARAHYAFVLATAAAALGRPTVLFATNEGAHALRADLSAMPDAADGEDRMAQAGVARLSEMREAAVELGIRLIACEAGLLAAAIPRKALLPQVEIAGVATFLSSVKNGQVVTL